ncbi:MAG: SDR family oxidoreductase [Promethearchaeota archaeon]
MHVVVTGSTRGIGKALANKFLEMGDTVIITSRSKDSVMRVVKEFGNKYSSDRVYGIQCDVTDSEQVDSLVNFAKGKLGTIDFWLNNAGTAGEKRALLLDLDPSEIKRVIETNILGTLFCCRAVLKVMIAQGSGHIFNMEGMGSDGMTRAKSLVYATSKSAIPMIKKTLLKETKGIPVGIHDMKPGMVLTDLLMKDNPDVGTKKVYNILAEKPETVAEYLVPKIRTIKGTGKKISYLSKFGSFMRFLTAWKYKNKFFDNFGNPVL